MSRIRLVLLGIITVACAILATLFYFAVPVLYFDYNTRLDPPSYISEQEKKRLTEERQKILKMENKGPGDSLMYNDIGILRSGYGDYRGAIRAFTFARSSNPQDPRFSRNMAIAYTNLNDYVQAEMAFREAFRLAPTQPEYWLELGELYTFKVQDKEKARLFYLEALDRTSQNLDVVKAYANFLENIEKDYTGAINYWQILVDKDEKNRVNYLAKIEELKVRSKTPSAVSP